MTAWPRRRVADLIDGLTAGVSVRSTTAAARGPAVLKTSAIDAGLFDPNESKAILPADLPRARCPVAADSLIVSRMNTPAMVGDVGYVAEAHEDIFLPDRLWLARAKRRSGTDMRWLTYYFASEPGARELRGLATGTSGSMKNIPKKRVLNLEIHVPPAPEQRAIARTLADADDLIVTLERLIAKKQAIKQGMMQQLLTGRARLPGFYREWELSPLGSRAAGLRGSGLSKSMLNSAGKNECVLYGELFTTYGRRIERVVSRTNVDGGVRSQVGDVLVPGSTTTVARDLATASAMYVDGALIGGDTNIVRPRAGIDSDWLSHYITHELGDRVAEVAQGTTIKHLYVRDLLRCQLPVPEIAEQRSIANVLLDAEREISLVKARLEKARIIKIGMMQQLLTGRTRLPLEATS